MNNQFLLIALTCVVWLLAGLIVFGAMRQWFSLGAGEARTSGEGTERRRAPSSWRGVRE